MIDIHKESERLSQLARMAISGSDPAKAVRCKDDFIKEIESYSHVLKSYEFKFLVEEIMKGAFENGEFQGSVTQMSKVVYDKITSSEQEKQTLGGALDKLRLDIKNFPYPIANIPPYFRWHGDMAQGKYNVRNTCEILNLIDDLSNKNPDLNTL